MRVVTPDVGGGFGTKLFPYREYALAAVAAQQLKRPVKWVAERSEHFLGDTQGRDNITTARLALDDKGKFLALEVDLIADMGAYLSLLCAVHSRISAPAMLPGVYDIPACYIRVRGAYTNTVPVDAYRGAGRPEAAYVIERLVDAAARELGIAPDALRRQEFHQAEGDAVHDADRQDLRLRRVRRPHGARAGDRRLGRLQEARGGGEEERQAARHRPRDLYRGLRRQRRRRPRRVQLDKDGGVTVLIGSQSTGQGHDTAYAQLVAEHLGLPPERVRMRSGRHRP